MRGNFHVYGKNHTCMDFTTHKWSFQNIYGILWAHTILNWSQLWIWFENKLSKITEVTKHYCFMATDHNLRLNDKCVGIHTHLKYILLKTSMKKYHYQPSSPFHCRIYSCKVQIILIFQNCRKTQREFRLKPVLSIWATGYIEFYKCRVNMNIKEKKPGTCYNFESIFLFV